MVFTDMMKFSTSVQRSVSVVLEGGESFHAVNVIPELWSTRQVLACSLWSRCGHPVVLEGEIVASRISLFLVLILPHCWLMEDYSGAPLPRLTANYSPPCSPYSSTRTWLVALMSRGLSFPRCGVAPILLALCHHRTLGSVLLTGAQVLSSSSTCCNVSEITIYLVDQHENQKACASIRVSVIITKKARGNYCIALLRYMVKSGKI